MQVVRRRFFRITDAAEYLGLSAATVRKFIAQGIIPARKLGGAWLIDIDELNDALGVLR